MHFIFQNSNEQNLFEIKIFRNIINVFFCHFEQFNASILDTNINLFQWIFVQVFIFLFAQMFTSVSFEWTGYSVRIVL